MTPIKSVLAQKRLSWYGHVMRREETHITRSTLNMTVMGTRPRGHPKMRWLDRLKSDMRIYGINPEMATDRERWAVMVKKRRHHLDGRRRKRLVKVSKELVCVRNVLMCTQWVILHSIRHFAKVNMNKFKKNYDIVLILHVVASCFFHCIHSLYRQCCVDMRSVIG